MSTIIYAVFADGGEYEDAYHNLIKVWTKKSDAEEQIFELTEIRDRKIATMESRNDHRKAWDEANPNTLVYPDRRPYPKWTGIKNQDITAAMRAERKAIQDEWTAQAKAYGDAMLQRDNAWWESCEINLIMNGVSPDMIEENSWWYGEDKRYVIEEVELD